MPPPTWDPIIAFTRAMSSIFRLMASISAATCSKSLRDAASPWSGPPIATSDDNPTSTLRFTVVVTNFCCGGAAFGKLFIAVRRPITQREAGRRCFGTHQRAKVVGVVVAVVVVCLFVFSTFFSCFIRSQNPALVATTNGVKDMMWYSRGTIKHRGKSIQAFHRKKAEDKQRNGSTSLSLT